MPLSVSDSTPSSKTSKEEGAKPAGVFAATASSAHLAAPHFPPSKQPSVPYATGVPIPGIPAYGLPAVGGSSRELVRESVSTMTSSATAEAVNSTTSGVPLPAYPAHSDSTPAASNLTPSPGSGSHRPVLAIGSTSSHPIAVKIDSDHRDAHYPFNERTYGDSSPGHYDSNASGTDSSSPLPVQHPDASAEFTYPSTDVRGPIQTDVVVVHSSTGSYPEVTSSESISNSGEEQPNIEDQLNAVTAPLNMPSGSASQLISKTPKSVHGLKEISWDISI